MKRGRIQLGLILSLLMVGAAVTAMASVFGPASSKQGPGIAFAQGAGGLPTAGGGVPVAAEEPAPEAPASNDESDISKRVRKLPHGPSIYETHASQTPEQLRTFETENVGGIQYSGVDSPVAQTTEKIRTLDVAGAAAQKYEIAKEFLSEDKFKRTDPLEITDAVPEELRRLYAGEDDLSALTDSELEQLFLSGVRTQLQYVPIRIIGTIDNGVQKMALIEYFGSKITVSVGDSRSLGRFPVDPKNPRRYMELSMVVLEIREDYVEVQFNINYTLLNGNLETLEPVKRRFYIRMAF